jgi:hypothetical protein
MNRTVRARIELKKLDPDDRSIFDVDVEEHVKIDRYSNYKKQIMSFRLFSERRIPSDVIIEIKVTLLQMSNE